MDFRLGEKSDHFRQEVRVFLDEHLTPEVIERVHRDGTVHDWGFYRALGERGWIAATWPEELGGQGRDPFEMVALREELELAGAPMDGMFLSMIVANTLRHIGTDAQKRDIIPRVIRGEILISLGYTEPHCGSDVAAARTRADRDGDEWVINGSKMFTTLAHEASYVFLLTRSNPDVPKHKGLTTFLVPMDSAGIEIQPVLTMGGERTNATFYTDVRVPDTARVGAADGGWAALKVALVYERARQGRGPADRLLRWALDCAATTSGLDGAPLIDDPLVRERIGRLALDAELAKLLGYHTAWVDASGGLPGVEGSMTKLFNSEALLRNAHELLDALGARGTIQHGEEGAPADGWIEHFFRHAQVLTIYGGTSEVCRSVIAEGGLGLPRSR
jgi:hypothetical protein